MGFPLEEEIRTILSMKPRQWVKQILTLGMVLVSALMMWKSLMLVVNSESPIVVVLNPITVGDIAVFKQEGREIPIVHRIHRVHERNDSANLNEVQAPSGAGGSPANKKLYILTKGDNNQHDDRVLYEGGRVWVHEDNLMGRSRAYLPFIGWLTILVAENPWLKVVVLSTMAFFVLTGKEEG